MNTKAIKMDLESRIDTILDWAPIPVYGMLRNVQRDGNPRVDYRINALNRGYQRLVTLTGMFAAGYYMLGPILNYLSERI